MGRINRAYEKTPNKKAGLFELLDMMRSPEFYAMLKAMRAMMAFMRAGKS